MSQSIPITFSEHFNIDSALLAKLNAFDPTLNADTRLYIDPLLLAGSSQLEMRKASQRYREHFLRVVKLVAKSEVVGDLAWRSAKKQLSFPEIPGTCLGYGKNNINGSGFGPKLSAQILKTTKEVVALGIEDPDLFPALVLFEKNIGADRIGDMVTNVILDDLLDFNQNTLSRLDVETEQFVLGGKRCHLPRNPFEKKKSPIILIPRDVLRYLPTGENWDEIYIAVADNTELRLRVNTHLGEVFKNEHRNRRKSVAKFQAFANQEAFKTMLVAAKEAARPYNINKDPKGELTWRGLINTIATTYPRELTRPQKNTLETVTGVTAEIIEQFKFLIEKRDTWKSLWYEDKPLPEKAAQRIFFAVALSYCKANNIDITPESDTGVGPVDFKCSKGFNGRVVVELKLSTNSKVVSGYTKQLEAYKDAEETASAFYVVVDVGRMGKKEERLESIKNNWNKSRPSKLVFVDGNPKLSASRR